MSRPRAKTRQAARTLAKHTRRPGKARAKPRGKLGGRRENSGPDPVLGPGNVRSVIKTVRLSPVEETAQIAAFKRAGAKDWGTWIRDLANAEAARNAKSELLAEMQAAGVTVVGYETDPAEENEPAEHGRQAT